MASPYSVQGIKKYIKIPDRRLISGFLNVNMINHNENDGTKDDLAAAVYKKWSGIGEPGTHAYPWNDDAPDADADNRDGMLQTFGDYDVMCFFVGGGMTLHNPVFGTELNQSDLYSAGYLNHSSGDTTWTDGTGGDYQSSEDWFSVLTHKCHHYIKYVPIARFNNAYGHDHADHRRGHPLHKHEITDGSYANLGGAPDEANTYLYSNGTYDTQDSDGTNLSSRSMNSTFGDLSDKTKNTYFTPVDRVKIYGEHDFIIPSHQSTGGNFVYTNGNSSVGNYAHPDGVNTVWNLVVDIGFLGIDENYGGGGAYSADLNWIKTRANVSFFPFGETASFDIADSIFS